MEDIHSYLADVVLAIKEDAKLKECFNQVLQVGSSTQQVRVATLLQRLEEEKAPVEVKKFVRLLSNDQLAHQVLKEINN